VLDRGVWSGPAAWRQQPLTVVRAGQGLLLRARQRRDRYGRAGVVADRAAIGVLARPETPSNEVR
jgi:hypothetical protein